MHPASLLLRLLSFYEASMITMVPLKTGGKAGMFNKRAPKFKWPWIETFKNQFPFGGKGTFSVSLTGTEIEKHAPGSPGRTDEHFCFRCLFPKGAAEASLLSFSQVAKARGHSNNSPPLSPATLRRGSVAGKDKLPTLHCFHIFWYRGRTPAPGPQRLCADEGEFFFLWTFMTPVTCQE